MLKKKKMEGSWNVQGNRIMPISPVRWLRKEKKRQDFMVTKGFNPKSEHSGFKKNEDLLSLVGSVFFSWVSVFFSLDLSKFSTSLMSGLSAMSTEALKDKKKAINSMMTSLHLHV